MYAIIPAPGWYGDYATVISVHANRADARKAYKKAGGGVRMLSGVDGHEAGDKIARAVIDDMTRMGAWRICNPDE